MSTREDLQAWLALEHEAVWLYGLIGARVDSLAEPALTSFEAHRAARDRLRAVVRNGGGQPVGPALTYGDELFDSRRTARAAARDVENRVAAACLTLLGTGDEGIGRFAMAGLRRAALASLDWGADPIAFPGLD
ncbi:DUF4439 domain-containing protein [Aeromicrobium sp.]|uniref:DUF4439 domain-containing protein n=1 Tax=Aeromicrobium sp. TaxID=1871063 RepID=UPI003D6B143A